MLEFGTENKELTKECDFPPFILSMNDTPDNELVVMLAPAIRGEKGESQNASDFPKNQSETIQEMLKNSYPVYEDMTRIYEIRFESYIMYQCRNESYTAFDPDEKAAGKYLLVFEKSKLLDYYEGVIFDCSTDEAKAGRRHYGIYTANHIIDIISDYPPVITMVSQEETPC